MMTGEDPTGGGHDWVVDVDEASFERAVVQASHQQPVVVDFWASWCAPCRMLGPVLERLADEGAGAWRLARLDVDRNPSLAMRFGVQGIPAVKAFRDGEVVSEFVGAQPEPMVRDFLRQILPGPADERFHLAHRREMAGEAAAAESAYREVLQLAPDHPGALLGLGRLAVGADRLPEAIDWLERVPYGAAERTEAEAWLARARFRQSAALSGGEVEARRRVAERPDDLDARLALARVMADKGNHREALEGLLTVLERDRGAHRDQARADMLGLFALLGDEHELTLAYRPRLAALLF